MSSERYTHIDNLIKQGDGTYTRKLGYPCVDIGSPDKPLISQETSYYRQGGNWYIKNVGYIVYHQIQMQMVSTKFDRVIAQEVWLPNIYGDK